MGSRFCVSSLKRAKSGAYKSRKRLPTDVRCEYQAVYGGPAWEEKFRRPAGTPPAKAKAEFAAWLAEIEGRVTTLRAKQRGEGHDLTQRDARALAGVACGAGKTCVELFRAYVCGEALPLYDNAMAMCLPRIGSTS